MLLRTISWKNDEADATHSTDIIMARLERVPTCLRMELQKHHYFQLPCCCLEEKTQKDRLVKRDNVFVFNLILIWVNEGCLALKLSSCFTEILSQSSFKVLTTVA